MKRNKDTTVLSLYGCLVYLGVLKGKSCRCGAGEKNVSLDGKQCLLEGRKGLECINSFVWGIQVPNVKGQDVKGHHYKILIGSELSDSRKA